MSFRRDRFGDLIRRQLDLFREDEAELLREADEAEQAYDGADRDVAEEAFGDYQLVLEAITDRLGDVRDSYASTLDDDATDEYGEAFARAVRKRYPKLTSEF